MNVLIAVGLAIAGAKFSSLTAEKDEELKVEKIKGTEDPNGENIYESKDFDKYKDVYYAKNTKRAEESKRAKETGMIPPRYNERPYGADIPDDFIKSDFLLHEYQDNINKPTDNDFSFLGNELKITNNTSNEQKYYEETKNDSSYIEQFEPTTFDNQGDPVAQNGIHASNDRMKQLNIERQMATDQSWSSFKKNKNMTYNVTPAEEFTHNNMVPFYKSKSYGSPEQDDHRAMVNQQKLELFTGSSNQIDYRPKTEVEAMFAPQTGLTSSLYGTPTISGQMRDRYAMSLTENRKRQSELPIEQIRVNPGLNLDYTEHGSDGYHPWYRGLDKNVDELRAGGKGDKVSLGNVVIPGMRGNKRGIQAPVNKNRPERFKEQLDEDILPSFGYITAQAPRQNYDLKTTLREQQMRAYSGNQYGNDIGQNIPDAMFPKIQTSSRQNIGSTGVRNVYENIGTMRANTQIGQNERSTTTINDWVGQANPYNNGFVIDPLDVPDPTMKQQTLYDTVKFSNTNTTLNTYTYDPNDIQPITLKQTALYQHSGILGSEYKAGIAYDPNDIPKTTRIEQIIDTKRIGNIIGNLLGTVQPMDTPQATTKEQFINNVYIGQAATNNHSYTYDPTDIAKTTRKEQTINTKYINAPNIPTQTGYLTNPQEAKTTARETTEVNKYLNGATRETGMGYITNPQEAKTTLRQLTVNNKIIGGVNRETGLGYITNPQEAKTTLRQLTVNNKTVGGVNRESGLGYITNPQNAKTTLRQLTVNNKVIGGASRESGMGYTTNPQEAKTTLRQLTVNNKVIGGVNRETGMGYTTNPHEAKITLRQLTGKTKHLVGVNRESGMGYTTNPHEAKTTLRQLTENNKIIGSVNRESGLGYITNPKTAKTTLRQLTGKNKHLVGVNKESGLGYTTNPKTAKTTLRQLTVNNKHAPNLDGVQTQTGYITNIKDAPVTIKQQTLYSYVGPTDARQTSTGYITNKHIAKDTVKQGTLYSYLGNAESNISKNSVYKSYYDAPIDNRKEILVKNGRLPTLSNYSKQYDGQFTEYRVKDDNDARHVNRRDPTPSDLNFNRYTTPHASEHVHQYLPQLNMRQDSMVLTQLNMNPFAVQLNPIHPTIIESAMDNEEDHMNQTSLSIVSKDCGNQEVQYAEEPPLSYGSIGYENKYY